MTSLIFPNWPQPTTVKACSSTRLGGMSLSPYDSLNLGTHVGDKPDVVEQNRHILAEMAELPQQPIWLEQVHGTRVVRLNGQPLEDKRADAVYTNIPGQVCAVMTQIACLYYFAVLPVMRLPLPMRGGEVYALAYWKTLSLNLTLNLIRSKLG